VLSWNGCPGADVNVSPKGSCAGSLVPCVVMREGMEALRGRA
jgi:hypothetical protein